MGWTPETVKDLEYSESLLLAVFFEEQARARRKKARGGGTRSGLVASRPGEVVVTEEEVDEDE